MKRLLEGLKTEMEENLKWAIENETALYLVTQELQDERPINDRSKPHIVRIFDEEDIDSELKLIEDGVNSIDVLMFTANGIDLK